jgi:hypothetical protein
MITLEQTVKRMKREILEDIQCGRVPDNVGSFGSLHDYVDGNEYGGLCEDETCGALIEQFGGRDEHEGMPQGMVDLINAAQNEVDAWIKSGELSKAAINAAQALMDNAEHGSHDLVDLVWVLQDECKRWAMRYNALKQENWKLQSAKVRCDCGSSGYLSHNPGNLLCPRNNA